MIHIQLSMPAYLKPPSIICHGISGILTPIMGATALVHAARKLPDTPQLVPSKEINNGQKPKTDASIKVMIPCPVSGPDSISDLELCYRKRGQTLEARILQPQSKYSVMNLSDHPQRDQ